MLSEIKTLTLLFYSTKVGMQRKRNSYSMCGILCSRLWLWKYNTRFYQIYQGSNIFKDCPNVSSKFKCDQKCLCKQGFVRNENDACFPVEKCKFNTPSASIYWTMRWVCVYKTFFKGCTGWNEEITACPSPCNENCEGKPAPDFKLKACSQKGCRCKKGFARNHFNVCIPKRYCKLSGSTKYNKWWISI